MDATGGLPSGAIRRHPARVAPGATVISRAISRATRGCTRLLESSHNSGPCFTQIAGIHLLRDRETDKFKGFGFVVRSPPPPSFSSASVSLKVN